MLREWDDAMMAGLLRGRPDLAFPTPQGYSQVASRATTRHSVSLALDALNAVELWIAEQLAARGSTTRTAEFIAELGGTDAGAALDAATIESAIDRLLTHALVWGDRSQVRPVRAMVGLLTTDDAEVTESTVSAAPPSPATEDTQTPALADKVGAGSAFEFVRRMDVLIEHCDHRPPRLVRAGGLSQRDIRGLADLLDVTPALTRSHLEIAEAAGLLGPSAHELNEVLMPTAAFDSWQGRSLAEQWVELVAAWAVRHPASGSAELKKLVLTAFGDPTDGITINAASLRPWLAWKRPRRSHGTDRQAALFLDLASWIGVTGLGALTSYAGSDLSAVRPAELDRLLPTRVDHVLVQADLTAVAPGPLTPEAARELGALAEVESRGGATVYRFSPESLTRARGLGWTTDDMLATLAERSRTPVPQALDYLIRDLDRHGSRGSALGDRAMGRTSSIGLSGAARHRSGARATAVFDTPELSPQDRIDDAHVALCLEELRHDTDDSHHAPEDSGSEPTQAPASSILAPIDDLREAAETGEVVWFGYVDPQGSSSERMVRALSVDEGLLVAEDSTTGEQLKVPLHRITSAHIIRNRG